MDEFMWAWLYQSWYKDHEETIKTYNDLALYVGAFSNPEMAQQIAKDQNPDHMSSEEDVEASMDVVRKAREYKEKKEESDNKSMHRRRRRNVIRD